MNQGEGVRKSNSIIPLEVHIASLAASVAAAVQLRDPCLP